VDHYITSSPGTADDRYTARIKGKKASGSKFDQFISSPKSGRSNQPYIDSSRGGDQSRKSSVLKTDLARMINDKSLIYKTKNMQS